MQQSRFVDTTAAAVGDTDTQRFLQYKIPVDLSHTAMIPHGVVRTAVPLQQRYKHTKDINSISD